MYYSSYGYGLFSGYFTSMIVLIPAIIFTMIVQRRIQSAFNRYSRVENSRRMTGAEAARQMLEANGLGDVEIRTLSGNALSNYYDPRKRSVNLSQAVHSTDSVAAMCIACHEVGHAIQHARAYGPLRIRSTLVPLVNVTQSASWPLIILGLLFSTTSAYGSLLFDIGTICFAVVVVFHLVTLPVEFDASRRALDQMVELEMVDDADYRGSRTVLRAAAMTYVAALATAAASLLRILLLRQGQRR